MPTIKCACGIEEEGDAGDIRCHFCVDKYMDALKERHAQEQGANK